MLFVGTGRTFPFARDLKQRRLGEVAADESHRRLAKGDREFADSPVEESGFEPLVPFTPKRGRCQFASK
jgi:hypothetical protein